MRLRDFGVSPFENGRSFSHIGKVIGETPANDPNGYSDVVCFYMPNSRIFIQILHKKFVQIINLSYYLGNLFGNCL